MNSAILIVDDDKMLLNSLSALLTNDNYPVTTASGGREALEKIKIGFYPLIILDVKMPDINGIEVLKQLREMQKDADHSMVIIVSGYDDKEVLVQAIKYGANDYMIKPFDLNEFLMSVKRNLRMASLEKEKNEYLQALAQKNEELSKTKEKLEDYNWALEKMVEEGTREFRLAEAKLIQSAKMAAIGQLGASVAHELNNPLGGILGYAQFILTKMKRPEFSIEDFKNCEEHLHDIEREALRCKEIVSHLLQFSRKPRTVKPEPVNIKKVIQDALGIIGKQTQLLNIEIISNVPDDLHGVMGNHNQLEQVFTNLIINAQEAMANGGKITINAFNTQGTPPLVRIEIIDTGCGILRENQLKIFEPFYTTKDKEKGTGLGLFVTYQIVQEHQGDIELESQPGKGSKFTIILPAATN